MAVHPNGQTVVTGASDSTINIWEDHTAQADQEARAADEGKELQQQELSNATRSKEYGRAVQLALKLDRPYQMYLVIKSMLLEGQPGELKTLMHGLVDEDLMRLLHFVRAWNTKAKQSEVSQEVLAALYECPGSIERLQSLEGMKEVTDTTTAARLRNDSVCAAIRCLRDCCLILSDTCSACQNYYEAHTSLIMW